MLPGVGGKAYDVEVALDEVDDHVFPHILLVLCRGVVPGRSIYHCTCSLVFVVVFCFRKKSSLVFHLDDGFSQVLHAGAFWRSPTDVDHLVRKNLK